MYTGKKITKAGFAVFAVVMMLAVAVAPIVSDQDSDAANSTYTINVQPGQTWEWTPSFPSGLTPTVTVSASPTSMPSDTATFAATSGNASVSSGKVTVSIPSNYTSANYYVKIKAQTTQPTQVVYYELTFNVQKYTLTYNASSVVAKVGTAITDLTPTTAPTGVSITGYAITGTLPTGLSFNTSTGVISGTPTAYMAQHDVTITATFSTTPSQTATAKISIGAFTNITSSSYTVYAIKGDTAISIPGTAMPTGTVLDKMDLTATKDGSSATVTAGTAYNGMTVAANTGAISGKPTVSGTYVFTEKYTATAATGGSTSQRTVTVVVEDPVTISGDSSFNSFQTHEDSVTLTKGGPASVTWSITKITKNGAAITSGTDFSSFSISNGVLKSSTATTAGTYVVTVKAVSANTTSNTSGATGTTPANNYATKDITVVVADKIEVYPEDIYFYEASKTIYDPVSCVAVNSSDSNKTPFAGATFSVKSYGTGLDATKIVVNPTTGAVTPGTADLAAGDYTATIVAQDPNNPDNKAEGTLHVHVVAVLAFTSEPDEGRLTVW